MQDAFVFGMKLASSFGVQPTYTAPVVSPVGGGKPTTGPDIKSMQQSPTLNPNNVIRPVNLAPLQAQNPQQKLAEIMLPGAQPAPAFSASSLAPAGPTLPPITGPLTTEDPTAFGRGVSSYFDTDSLTGVNPHMRDMMEDNSRRLLTEATQVAAAPHVKIQQEAARRQAESAAAQQRAQAELEAIRPGARYHDWSKGPTRAQTLYEHFVERPKQTLREYGEMGRAFASGFSPKVNPVTGFIDRATDPNIGLSGAVAHAVGANDPNSLVGRTRAFVKNVEGTAQNAKNLSDKVMAAANPTPADPAALEAAKNTPSPTMGSYLADSFKQNPLLWSLPVAGLGGLGAYGLYKALQARKDAKKRRRLMSPAAIIN